jgi:hypothetical protein
VGARSRSTEKGRRWYIVVVVVIDVVVMVASSLVSDGGTAVGELCCSRGAEGHRQRSEGRNVVAG